MAARVFGAIEDEYDRTVDVICRITGQTALLDISPSSQHSIQRRNPYVDPLSFIQLVILERSRRAPSPTRNSSPACWKASTASRRD